MKIKNKLRLGFGFLFIVVLFFGALSIFYINEISNNAKVILKDNYESLNYSSEMRAILDNNDLPLKSTLIAAFDQQLVKEEHNITEAGEGDATKELRVKFTQLQNSDPANAQPLLRDMRKDLRKIELVNMQAIVRKNERAHSSVDHATILLSLVGAVTFLILFSFSVNFPGFVADPLNVLIAGIREIAQQNYKQRIHFDKNDEFAELAGAFNDMASRLNEWENSNLSKILSQKSRIETIIEQMRDAIIGINEKKEVLFINTAAKELLNLPETIKEGTSLTDMIKSNDLLRTVTDKDVSLKPFKIVVNGRDSYYQLESREILIPNIGNEGSSVLNIAQRSAGKVYILKNVTEFKELDEAKTNFIATISHELKTPIAAIKMSLKLMADNRVGELNNEQGQLVEHMTGDIERLLKITYELLDLSQVETGNIQLNFVPANAEQIVAYAVKAVKFEADRKEIIIEQHLPAHLPKIQADVEKTAWVMINFLSNAIRYTSAKSKILIDVSEKDKMIEFSVKDFGKGIDKQYRERLFDRYFQVPTDGQNRSGSGLGLAISKEFINAQGGGIGVESEVGEGSRFYFRLPVSKG